MEVACLVARKLEPLQAEVCAESELGGERRGKRRPAVDDSIHFELAFTDELVDDAEVQIVQVHVERGGGVWTGGAVQRYALALAYEAEAFDHDASFSILDMGFGQLPDIVLDAYE